MGCGVHITGLANNNRQSQVDVTHIRNPNVAKGADGKLRLADRSGHAYAQHWGNHGNWQGATTLRYVRPATRAELARVPRLDYVRRALGAAEV